MKGEGHNLICFLEAHLQWRYCKLSLWKPMGDCMAASLGWTMKVKVLGDYYALYLCELIHNCDKKQTKTKTTDRNNSKR